MDYSDWIGRSEQVTDAVTPTPFAALSAMLDQSPERPPHGTPLPPLWHWLYFLPLHRQSDIGADGHAKRGDFLPPIALPRRMWAGSQFTFHTLLRIGDDIRRVSTIDNVTRKIGRTGELIFVKVRHDISRGPTDELAITEFHEIVYREAAGPGTAPASSEQAPPKPVWERRWDSDDVLLFRYSALTFNGHRIHYDRRYVTQVEGYPGLIVHGPLMATLMIEQLRSKLPSARVRTYRFRAIRPVFDTAPFHICGAPTEDEKVFRLWVRLADGALAVDATVELL